MVTHMRLYLYCLICKRYYIIGITTCMRKKQGKYLIQTRSQAKTSGTILPMVHSIDK